MPILVESSSSPKPQTPTSNIIVTHEVEWSRYKPDQGLVTFVIHHGTITPDQLCDGLLAEHQEIYPHLPLPTDADSCAASLLSSDNSGTVHSFDNSDHLIFPTYDGGLSVVPSAPFSAGFPVSSVYDAIRFHGSELTSSEANPAKSPTFTETARDLSPLLLLGCVLLLAATVYSKIISAQEKRDLERAVFQSKQELSEAEDKLEESH